MQVARTADNLADLILKGRSTPGVSENNGVFIGKDLRTKGYIACAIGMAYIGLIGDPKEAHRLYWESDRIGVSPYKFFAQELGVSMEMVEKVSYIHSCRTPAAVIADEIRTWKVVEERAMKPSLLGKVRAWWSNTPVPSEQPRSHLRLVTTV